MDLKKLTFYKKDDSFEKTNYRPISILPILSKAVDHCMYDEIYEYIDNLLSKAQWMVLEKDSICSIHQ